MRETSVSSNYISSRSTNQITERESAFQGCEEEHSSVGRRRHLRETEDSHTAESISEKGDPQPDTLDTRKKSLGRNVAHCRAQAFRVSPDVLNRPCMLAPTPPSPPSQTAAQ